MLCYLMLFLTSISGDEIDSFRCYVTISCDFSSGVYSAVSGNTFFINFNRDGSTTIQPARNRVIPYHPAWKSPYYRKGRLLGLKCEDTYRQILADKYTQLHDYLHSPIILQEGVRELSLDIENLRELHKQSVQNLKFLISTLEKIERLTRRGVCYDLAPLSCTAFPAYNLGKEIKQ